MLIKFIVESSEIAENAGIPSHYIIGFIIFLIIQAVIILIVAFNLKINPRSDKIIQSQCVVSQDKLDKIQNRKIKFFKDNDDYFNVKFRP